jgi:hypothetical protein
MAAGLGLGFALLSFADDVEDESYAVTVVALSDNIEIRRA